MAKEAKTLMSNSELAEGYTLVISEASGSCEKEFFRIHQEMRGRIENAPVSIAGYCSRHGNLNGLSIHGIGEKTIGILEKVLQYGVDEARERQVMENAKKIREERDYEKSRQDISGISKWF